MTPEVFPDIEGAAQLHPVYKLGRLFDILFAPLMPHGMYQMALIDVYASMNHCRRQMRREYVLLMEFFTARLTRSGVSAVKLLRRPLQ